jgi:NAD-dependent SIR2 family protein deacetylase
MEKLYCSKCGTEVKKETDKELRKEYPYYCPECDENLYSFETTEKA